MTHICVSDLTIIGSDNGLSPGRRQAIIRTNAGILLIRPLGTNFSENFNPNSNIFIQVNAFENVVCEKAAILSRPQCVNELLSLLCLECNQLWIEKHKYVIVYCKFYRFTNKWYKIPFLTCLKQWFLPHYSHNSLKQFHHNLGGVSI